jgi:hypothetical protein
MGNKKISYPSTKQFRDTVRDVTYDTTFNGFDENDQPVFNSLAEKPKILFEGTVKLHGTNAGVSVGQGEVWVQSRNRVVNSLTGHMGFAEFVHANREYFQEMYDRVFYASNGLIEEGSTITFNGEWCGKGIQQGVAISESEHKMFFLFAVKVTPPTEKSFWLPENILTQVYTKHDRVYVLRDLRKYYKLIDFNKPAMATEALIELTNKVEEECPVSKLLLDVSGVGEGIVWVGWYNEKRYIFKVKGDKHSSSKVKKLAQVDAQKMQSVYDFVDYAATDNRIEQGIGEVKQSLEVDELTKKNTPDLLRWVANDIIKEESDVLQSNGIEWKDVGKHVSDRVRRVFFAKIDMV